MKKCCNASILFLILAALNYLESAAIPTEKQVAKGPEGSESGEWVYESFSVTVDGSTNEDGESGFKIDKSDREAELMRRYEQYKAAEEQKKMVAKMAELEAMEAEIEAKRAQVEARKAILEAVKMRKGEKVEAVRPMEVEQIEVVKPMEVEEMEEVAQVAAVKQEAMKQEVVKQEQEDFNDEDQIEVLRVTERQSQSPAKSQSSAVVKKFVPMPQVQVKKGFPALKSPALARTNVRLSQNKAEFYDFGSSASDSSVTETETETDSDSEFNKMGANLKAIKVEEANLKAVKVEEVAQAKQQVQQQQQQQQQQQKVQQQQQQVKNLNLARMSARVPAASPIVGMHTEGPAAGNPPAARKSILKLQDQPGNVRKSVTLADQTAKPKGNLNNRGFDGDDDEDDYFSTNRGRQTQGHVQQQQEPNFYEAQMSRMSTNPRINSRQSQFHPSQYAYEDEQDSDQVQGHDLSGVRLSFCEAAALGAIANIRMMSLKYPRQANSVERKKSAQYISSLIENFPCEKEKMAMKKAANIHPPIYTERRSFNKWAIQFTKTVLKEIKSPVGLSMSNLMVPLKNKK